MSLPNETSNKSDETFEKRFWNNHPALLEKARQDSRFVAYHQEFRTVNMDGVLYYVRGDLLRDEEQLLFDFAWREGIITRADVEQSDENAISTE